MMFKKGWLKEVVRDVHTEIRSWSDAKKRSARIDGIKFKYAKKEKKEMTAFKPRKPAAEDHGYIYFNSAAFERVMKYWVNQGRIQERRKWKKKK